MTIFTFIIYYASWVAAIYFASIQEATFAALVPLFAIILQILLWSYIDRKRCLKEFFLACYAFLIGLSFETLYMNLGVTAFPMPGILSFLPPLWIVLLYPLLSLTLSGPFAWMVKKYSLAIFFGMLAPLCYIGGEKVGACFLPLGYLTTFLVIGPASALMLTIMSKLAGIVKKTADLEFQKMHNADPLTLLFDGECPICSREIAFLKKKDSPIGYIDISREEFRNKGIGSISYNDAMRGMIAIDSKNTMYQGISAFREIYVRRGWPLISIMLTLPGFKQIFSYAYAIFAKIRPSLKKWIA